MKRAGAAAIALAIMVIVFSRSVWGSGYHPPMAAFGAQDQPDPPLDRFAAGRLGLIQPGWGTTYLYVAYRYLAGPGFDPEEQKVLLSLWNEKSGTPSEPNPQSDWLAARSKIPVAPAMQEIDHFAPGPGYSFFGNCNDDAFRTASATLQSIVAKFGTSSPQVKQWLNAQDMVFQNCPGSKKSPHIPQRLNGGSPFEQAQRAYQIASANFYAENFDTAAGMFTAIARDSTSPWRTIAPYLVARATIRKATLSGDKNDNGLLAQAETQLNAIVAGSAPDNLKAAAQRLLGFVGCRLHPEERNAQADRAIMRPGSERTLAQDLNDYLHCGSPRQVGDFYAEDLVDWIGNFNSGGYQHSIDKWQRTALLAWLVAALAQVPGSDPRAEALIKAAQDVEPSSPAYITIAFHVDRILIEQGKTEDARARLDAILARPDALPHSAFNQFAQLRLKFAGNLDEYLTYALRYAVAIEGDVSPDGFDDPYLRQLAAGPLLDVDSAEILDRWLPLNVLKQAARSPILPPPLRARVAPAVWMRSILLGDRPTARELTPIVGDLVPNLKPSLDAWLAAKTENDQSFTLALMMLRNPGLRPYADPGIGRTTALDQLDYLRDNWWSSLNYVAPQPQPTPTNSAVAAPSPVATPPPPVAKYPSFLSVAERASADREWRQLSAIDGPEFLCNEVIRHARVSPYDARNPEALYRCIGAVQVGPANGRCDVLAASAFRLLHRRYAHSIWAEKNRFSYRGGGAPMSLAESLASYIDFYSTVGAR